MIEVYGELDEKSGKIVVLTNASNDWDVRDIGIMLSLMTPKFHTTKEGPILVPVSWEAVTQLTHTFPTNGTRKYKWVPGVKLSKWIFDEIMRRSCQGDLIGEQPKRPPMPHQSSGAIAIGLNGTFLLADEPGAGKTTAVLMGMAELAARGRDPFPALVVCPAAVIDPWMEEMEQVYPQWKSMPYRGLNRKRLLKSDAQILVMSYETMRNDMGDAGNESVLVKYKPSTVVFDEAHKLANYDTKQSVRARRLAKHVPHVICATGTPITKNAGNFWPILNSMQPEAYPDQGRFKTRYTLEKGQDYGHPVPGGLDPVNEPEFRDIMRGTMRRVAKADIDMNLPPKTYQTRWLDLPAKWRVAYDEMEEDMLAHMPDEEESNAMTAMSMLAKMTRLRQLACSACTVEHYEEFDSVSGLTEPKMRVTPKEPCWKGEALLEIMAELHQDDEGTQIQHGHRPVITAAPYRQLVMLAGHMAERRGYKVGYIVGGMTDKQRTEARHSFQGNELDLICVSTGAGGTGLTLTAADTMVFLARPWSMVEALQMEDRAHRRGQTKSVQIIDLETRNSVESRVRSALKDKMHNLAELVQDRRMVTEFLGGSK